MFVLPVFVITRFYCIRSDDGDRDSKNGDLDMPVDPNEPTYCICDKVGLTAVQTLLTQFQRVRNPLPMLEVT